MIRKGDYVIHNIFPPIEGVVSVIVPDGRDVKFAVMQSTGVLYWDDSSTWDLMYQGGDIIEAEVIDVDSFTTD